MSSKSNSPLPFLLPLATLDESARFLKPRSFWLLVAALLVSQLLSALELSAISTALPTIAKDLQATDFVWVGTAYTLASTAFLPMSGGLAQVFGRRASMIVILAIFAVGSAICGASTSMTMLIAGRTVQGIGGGGIQSLVRIILADLVPLRERGIYAAAFGLVWCIASLSGPVLGGSLADRGQWRWLFYLNLPIVAIAEILVISFLNLPVPPGNMGSKLRRMDWIGNFIIISSLTLFMIAMTWGGIEAPWVSTRVLIPLTLGSLGLVFFFFYEALIAQHPLVPLSIISNRTSISGYIQTFLSGVTAVSVVYWFPVYWQACHEISPVGSGLFLLGFASLAPAAVASGVLVKVTQRYRPIMWTGWIFAIVGMALLSILKVDTSKATAIGVSIVAGVGLGIEYTTTIFPIQAPLPVTQNAAALAFLQFVRSFASVWGVTLGVTILQNQLTHDLPSDFLSLYPGGVAITYSLIPEIPHLPPPLNVAVKAAFGRGLSILWAVLCGATGIGLVSSLIMKAFPLHSHLDKEWTIQETAHETVKDEEKLDIAQSSVATSSDIS